ncbi:hypothetical protein CDAR_570211 [Caerostris darwini]|uniref:Uncharacterized protein n=1 Tax=Caerostris darwini TaxID=1538125 RepID=A0AAV4STV5_9ARAC|nr:hypothetical protein CDAR_570211 [Caerostris darwini]
MFTRNAMKSGTTRNESNSSLQVVKSLGIPLSINRSEGRWTRGEAVKRCSRVFAQTCEERTPIELVIFVSPESNQYLIRATHDSRR